MRDPQIGDRVVTNNLEWGIIESQCDWMDRSGIPWFNVRLDNGRREMQDASRMSKRHPFGDADPGLPTLYPCPSCGVRKMAHPDNDCAVCFMSGASR